MQYLRLERSYTGNTLDAYVRDLQKLLNYYADLGIDFRRVTLEQLDQFSGTLQELGVQPRSVARILSGVRSFYRFLVLEKEIETDPTELLENPQIGKHLPEVLSIQEIDDIEQVIDTTESNVLSGFVVLMKGTFSYLKIRCELSIADILQVLPVADFAPYMLV